MSVTRSVVFFAFAFFCGSSTGSPYRSLGYIFFPSLYGWIRLETEPTDWLTARINCHMQGAFLVSPWSEEFVSYVGYLRINAEPIYSGIHSTYAEGALVFKDGKPVISINPQDMAPLDRCGVFFANGTTGLLPCDLKLSYFCYVPGTDSSDPSEWMEPALSLTLETECGDESLGYEFSEETGRCYKFHANAVHTWDDAKKTCIEEGGQLAIINSRKEAQVLSALFKRYPPSKIFGAPYPDTAAVGVYKRDNFYFTNDWRTVEGETLENAGYASWATNSPHPLATYGFIDRDGLLYGYVPAIRNIPFICEKNPMDLNYMPSSTPEAETEEATEDSVSSASGLCDTGFSYFEPTGNCYKFEEEYLDSFNQAELFCAGQMALVADVNTEKELYFLISLYKENSLMTENPSSGSSSTESWKDNAVTDDGMELYESNFEFVIRNDKGYAYNTIGERSRFICEKSTKSGLEPTTTTETATESKTISATDLVYDENLCGEEHLGYMFSERTGQCYKFHAQSVKTWNDAKEGCEAEGAHLAIVNSQEEASTLMKLYALHPNSVITGAQFPDTAAIGFYYNDGSHEWQTLDGENLEQAGYNLWRPNAPFISAVWGFICRDGLLYGYVPAIRDMPYICEKKPYALHHKSEEFTTTDSELDDETSETTGSSFPTEYPEMTESSFPTETSEMTESSFPTETSEMTESSFPTETSEMIESSFPTETPEMTVSSFPTETSEMTESSFPTETPEMTESSFPTETPEMTESSFPTENPETTGRSIATGNPNTVSPFITETDDIYAEEQTLLTPPLSCGDNSLGYKLDEYKNLCYKRHIIMREKDYLISPEDICIREGAHIVPNEGHLEQESILFNTIEHSYERVFTFMCQKEPITNRT